jgi:molybdopterin-binding protein
VWKTQKTYRIGGGQRTGQHRTSFHFHENDNTKNNRYGVPRFLAVTEVYKLANNVIVLESGKEVKRGTPEEVFLGKRLSTRVQVTGKVVGIEHDSIMASVTVMHADQFFKTLIDTEELKSLNLRIGDDVIIGVKSSDVILFRI